MVCEVQNYVLLVSKYMVYYGCIMMGGKLLKASVFCGSFRCVRQQFRIRLLSFLVIHRPIVVSQGFVVGSDDGLALSQPGNVSTVVIINIKWSV